MSDTDVHQLCNIAAQFYNDDDGEYNNNQYQCECSCHVQMLSVEALQAEKEKVE
jgi:hypothetical protein